MAPPVYSVGQVWGAADVNNWALPGAAYRTSTQTVTSSTTLVNDTQLVVSVAANAVYDVLLALTYDADAAGDLKTGWALPASATIVQHAMGLSATAASASDDQTVSPGATPIWGGLGAGNNCVLVMTCLLTVSSTSGTLQLQWAQGTSSGVSTRVFAGSKLKLDRVG